MKIKKNGEIINLTESDLRRIVKKTLNEQSTGSTESSLGNAYSNVNNPSLPASPKPILNALLDSGVEINEYEYVGDYKRVKLEITGPRKEVREVKRNLKLNGFIPVGKSASSVSASTGEVSKMSQTGEYLVPKDFDYTTL